MALYRILGLTCTCPAKNAMLIDREGGPVDADPSRPLPEAFEGLNQ